MDIFIFNFNTWLHKIINKCEEMKSSKEIHKSKNMSVLVLGIYLSDQKNNIEHIIKSFSIPCRWIVTQKWVAIGGEAQWENVKKVTVMNLQNGLPKYALLNKMLSEEDLGYYDFVIICDDDIGLPAGFPETYLDLVVKYDFALAQPARTHNSYIDWPFVEQLNGLNARRTRFVEIGPLFSVRRDIFSNIFPFDENTYMGWGYDFVWPCLIEKLGLNMGIIDATPVDHSIRKPVMNYEYHDAKKTMEDYLSRNPHLTKEEAFQILKSYAQLENP